MTRRTASSSRRRRRTGLAALALVLAVLGTGCLTVGYDLRVQEDGSGELRVELIFSEELSEQFGDFLDPEQLAGGSTDGLPPELRDKVALEPVDEDGRTGIRVTIRFDDVEELNRIQSDAAQAQGGQPVGDVVLEQRGDGWEFRVPVGDTSAGAQDELSQQFADAFGQVAGGLGDLGELEVRYAVTLPGEIVESNSEDVDGGTARWRFTLTESGPSELFARSGPASGFSISSATWAIAAVVLVALVGGVVLLRRRRTTLPTIVVGAGTAAPSAPAGPPTAPPAGPPPGFGPPPGAAPVGGWGPHAPGPGPSPSAPLPPAPSPPAPAPSGPGPGDVPSGPPPALPDAAPSPWAPPPVPPPLPPPAPPFPPSPDDPGSGPPTPPA